MSEEKDTSKDDKWTEQEALARAKKKGIEFVDEFRLAKVDSGIGSNTLPESYKTRAEAEKALNKRKDSDQYHILQTRRQATESDENRVAA